MAYKDVAVAWIRKDKNGKDFISMKASRDIREGETVRLFTNAKNGVEARPDYRAYETVEEAPQQITQQVDIDEIPF